MKFNSTYQNQSIKIAGLFLIMWAFLSISSYYLIVRGHESLSDFFPRWVGAREMLQGNDPYAESVTADIQISMFGQILDKNNQYRFVYAPVITWLLLPFWVMPSALATSLWCGLQLTLLLAAPLMVISSLKWKIRPFSLFVLLFFSIFVYRYPMNAYVLGQFIPFVFACLILVLWLITENHELSVGLVLVWLFVKPEVAVFPAAIFILCTLGRRARKIMLIWVAGGVFLWLLTRLWIGPWEWNFIEGILAYQANTHSVSPLSLLGSPTLSFLMFILIVIWVIWMVREFNRVDHISRPVWILSVAVLFSLLILPQTGNYTLVFALIPAWLMMWVAFENFWSWLPILAILTSPWIFKFIVNPASLEHLLIPLMLAVALSFYWHFWKKKNSSDLSVAE